MMLEQILNSVKLLYPETTLTVTFCLLILADLILRKRGNSSALIALLGLFVTAYFVVQQTSTGANSIFSNMLAVDSFSIYFKFVILASAIFVVIFSM